MQQDCEARLQFVRAGLPAGPRLPPDEHCAICLEPFETGERVQPLAACRHIFHADCIKKFLHSQHHLGGLFDKYDAPCPLCRSPLMADSIVQVPHRERPLAITFSEVWLNADSTTSTHDESAQVVTLATSGKVAVCPEIVPEQKANSTLDTDATFGMITCVVLADAAAGRTDTPCRITLRRAGSSPLCIGGASDRKVHVVFK